MNTPGTQPIFIAYYTPGPYEGDARLLRESLNALEIEHEVVAVPDLGTWQRCTQFKPSFVRDMLRKHAGRPVVYIDVDAFVVKQPELLKTLTCDIAATRFQGQELLSGTVYFGDTAKAREVVDTWCALCEQYPERLPDGRDAWDQRVLDMAIRQTPDVSFVELPQSYTWMVGLTQRRYPDVDPIILHSRGSFRHNPSHR